jgi:hypothetical protein
MIVEHPVGGIEIVAVVRDLLSNLSPEYEIQTRDERKRVLGIIGEVKEDEVKAAILYTLFKNLLVVMNEYIDDPFLRMEIMEMFKSKAADYASSEVEVVSE